MERIELKSSQSRFCDSNIQETAPQTTMINACLDINDLDTSNSSTICEDNRTLQTYSNKRELESFIFFTSKQNLNYIILGRISTLISQAKECLNKNYSEECFFKRKDSLFTLKSIECFQRIIEKKQMDVCFSLMKYFELVLIYENVSELTNDREALVKLINSIFSVIKIIDNSSVTNILEYRLQILIKKVLILNSSEVNNPNELLIKNALTPLLQKDEICEIKKKEVIFEI
jgi:hypothetical protein